MLTGCFIQEHFGRWRLHPVVLSLMGMTSRSRDTLPKALPSVVTAHNPVPMFAFAQGSCAALPQGRDSHRPLRGKQTQRKNTWHNPGSTCGTGSTGNSPFLPGSCLLGLPFGCLGRWQEMGDSGLWQGLPNPSRRRGRTLAFLPAVGI